jgi:hypothetical protein
MNQDERRELSTADLARSAEANERAVAERREAAARRATSVTDPNPNERAVLFPNDQADHLRTEWTEIQGAFVDAPREAVQRADALVANTMKRIAEVFAAERQNLEQQWDRGDNVTTEDLRVALQRYRGFFDRLLSV